MKLYISTGNSRMEKKWNGQEMEFSVFLERLSHTVRTSEQNQRKSGIVCVRHGQMLPHRRVHSTVWKMPRGVRMKMRDIPYLMNLVK